MLQEEGAAGEGVSYRVRPSNGARPQVHTQNVLSPSNLAAPAQPAWPSPSCSPSHDRHQALLASCPHWHPGSFCSLTASPGFSPMILLMLQPSGQRHLGSRPPACTGVPSPCTPTPPQLTHPFSTPVCLVSKDQPNQQTSLPSSATNYTFSNEVYIPSRSVLPWALSLSPGVPWRVFVYPMLLHHSFIILNNKLPLFKSLCGFYLPPGPRPWCQRKCP